MSSYKDLTVYKKSYLLMLDIYRDISLRLPLEERFGLISQIKRAATSIPLNIAEGYGKQAGAKETARFIQMARGSCSEMSVLLDILKDLCYLSVAEYEVLSNGYDEVGKMLTGLLKQLSEV